jgi:hypothetical protein
VSWLRRPSGLASPLLAPVATPPEPTAPVEHSAPGLREALARLPRPGASVLDLGAVSSVNVDFFNRLQAKILVFDLEDTLREAGLWDAPAKLPPWLARLGEVVTLGDQRFDLILAWDYANYLGRDRWPAVARELASRLAPRGSLHLLLRSGKTMPSRPGRYRLASKESIVEEAHSFGTTSAPRFAHAEIERLHPGLAAAKSFLDKHGVQEIVLERSEELNLAPRPTAQPKHRRNVGYEPGIAAGVTTSGAHRRVSVPVRPLGPTTSGLDPDDTVPDARAPRARA